MGHLSIPSGQPGPTRPPSSAAAGLMRPTISLAGRPGPRSPAADPDGKEGPARSLSATALVLVSILTLPVGPLVAEAPAPAISPFGKKPARKDARGGVVILNNGERIEGEIFSTRDRALAFKDEKTGETHEWTLGEVRRVSQEGKETIEADWRWKESGSDEKVYTGHYYRHVDLKVTVTLTGGEEFSGHWRTGAPIRVRSGRDVRRFVLYNEVKNVEKKTRDRESVPALIYIREIDFRPQQEER